MTYQNAFNPAVTRRNLIAGVAGLGAAGYSCRLLLQRRRLGFGSASGAGEFKDRSMGSATGAATSTAPLSRTAPSWAARISPPTPSPLFPSARTTPPRREVRQRLQFLRTGHAGARRPHHHRCFAGGRRSRQLLIRDLHDHPVRFQLGRRQKTCVFQACFNDPNQGANAATKLAEMFPDEKFVVFDNSGDTYSSGIRDAFRIAKAEELKLKNSWTRRPSRTIPRRFTNQLTKAKDKGATMILRSHLLHPRLGAALQRRRHGL